jgi:hypothetical protein
VIQHLFSCKGDESQSNTPLPSTERTLHQEYQGAWYTHARYIRPAAGTCSLIGAAKGKAWRKIEGSFPKYGCSMLGTIDSVLAKGPHSYL